MTNQWCSAARRWVLAFAVALAGFGGNASAILLDRGPDMVYDTVLDITWTRQADDNVFRNWADANAWAAGLVFGGFDDWRLPFGSVAAGAGPTSLLTFPGQGACTGVGGPDEVACRDNEMGYMFYYNLDGNLGEDKRGTQAAVGGEQLIGIGDGVEYWSATDLFGSTAWAFNFSNGENRAGGESNALRLAWAVRDGDVAAVPEPASLLLLGLGALGLGWSRRRRQ